MAVSHTLEKAVKGSIYPFENILQDLGVHIGQLRAYLFTVGQFGALMRVAQGDPCHAVGVPAFLQCRVVDFAAKHKPRVQQGLLFVCRIEPVVKGLVHLT